MYIPEFVRGVFATLFTEIALLIIFAFTHKKKGG